MTEPIDELHARCLAERDRIRAVVRQLRAEVARWAPTPPPKEFR